MFNPPARPRGPTEAEYAVVKDIYEKTKILAVKDAVTGKWVKEQKRTGGVPWTTPFQDRDPYGSTRHPNQAASHDRPGDSVAETYVTRACYGMFVGSEKYPNGVMVGGYEVWRQDNYFEDTEKHSAVNFWFDISTEELAVLKSFCNGTVYVTDEMWKAKAKEAEQRREHQLETQQDPVGAVAKTMGPALAEAFATAMAQAQQRGPTPEMMASWGWKQVKPGVWEAPKPAEASA